MSYSLRNYRHRNPPGGEEKKASAPFFQPQSNKVSRKKKEAIQRLATSKEDEKLATNDARMEKDKEEPMKPVQKKDAPKKEKKKEEKKSGKKGGAPEKGKKKEEEKPVQKMDKKEEKKPGKKMGGKDQEKPGMQGGKKEEEKPVQKKQKKEEEKPAKKKEEKETTSMRVAEEIKRQSGKGRPLPPHLMTDLSKSMGADLSGVSIHTDEVASRLCQELHALAFTHGRDIFFDSGRYNPESPEGMKLLVHELAHVVQQSNTEF